MSDLLSLPHFQQSAEGSCLAACVRMVLAHLSLERSESDISRLLGVQPFGVPSFAVRQLGAWGLRVVYREWSVPQLLSALEADQPVIIFVRTGFLDYWRKDAAHAVVIVGAEEGQQFWLHDPALSTGPTLTSWNGVLAAWAEFGCRGASISRDL
jgi:ABC-type bacteriocin/lantibiotic exporter with double-glycine peptidase domain